MFPYGRAKTVVLKRSKRKFLDTHGKNRKLFLLPLLIWSSEGFSFKKTRQCYKGVMKYVYCTEITGSTAQPFIVTLLSSWYDYNSFEKDVKLGRLSFSFWGSR